MEGAFRLQVENTEFHGTQLVLHKNGKVKAELEYDMGTCNGPYRVYSAGGKLLFETTVADGYFSGNTTAYSAKGQVLKELFYEDTRLHGEQRVYHSDGRPWIIANYKRGNLYGELIEHCEDGTKIEDFFVKSVCVTDEQRDAYLATGEEPSIASKLPPNFISRNNWSVDMREAIDVESKNVYHVPRSLRKYALSKDKSLWDKIRNY